MTIDVKKIEKIMELMDQRGFDVVQAESKGEKISLARHAAHAAFFQPQAAGGPSAPSIGNKADVNANQPHVDSAQSQPQASSASQPATPAGETIKSPFVGTFYRSPSPSQPPFVEVGSRVKKGQALCIVEAMKLMNEIESEVEGEVVAILHENGKPVEFGTPLFVIAPAR